MSNVYCTNDMNWVVPKVIGVGNMDSVMSGPWLVKNNIGGIVSVRGRLSKPPAYYRKHGIQVLHIPVSDSETTDLGKYFPMVFNFIDRIVQSGRAVLINCYAGISRSTTLVTSYLMRKYKIPAAEAMAKVKAQRPCFDPNPGFVRQLHKYEKVLRKHKLL
jgi:hypothetical protein